jgi:hypothetical protein
MTSGSRQTGANIQRTQAETTRELYVEIQNVCEYLKSKDGENFAKDFAGLSEVAQFEMTVYPTTSMLRDIDKIVDQLQGSKSVPVGPFENLSAEEKDRIIDAFT